MIDTDTTRPTPLAFTRRRVSNDPIGHAATSQHNGRSVRSSFVALCGAAIAWPGPGTSFDPDHPRACHRCAKQLVAMKAARSPHEPSPSAEPATQWP